MKITLTTFALLIPIFFINAQKEVGEEEKDYIEFNDRSNIVHGVYLGINGQFGEMKGKSTYGAGIKIAYVANQQFEVGMVINAFYSDQEFIRSSSIDNDLVGAYIGAHLEPILFSKRKISLGFPLFLGVGGIGYVTDSVDDFDDDFIDAEFKDVDTIFVVEPGVSALFNFSRYLQLEAGIKYRFSNRIDLTTSPIKNLNGFSAGIGVKIGVFNMGRNRYKKNIEE